MKRIAITLPDYQADAIERICRWRGVSRSRIIQRAVELYLVSQEALEEADRACEAGYRAYPEDPTEAEAYARAAAEVLGQEEWT